MGVLDGIDEDGLAVSLTVWWRKIIGLVSVVTIYT